MKRKHLALLLVAAMTVTSVDATALVSAADFSAEVTEDAAVQEDDVLVDEDSADVDIADEKVDAAETDSEEATVEDVDLQDENDEAVAEESADNAGIDELFSDGEETAEEAGEQGSFIPTTGVTAMNLDTEYTINFTKQGEEKWYSFTPVQSGNYIFEIVNNDSDKIDADGYLYNESAKNEDNYIGSFGNGIRGIKLAANQTYYYRATWFPATDENIQGGSYTAKVYKAVDVKSVKMEPGSVQTKFYQGLENISFAGSTVVVGYADGTNATYTVDGDDNGEEFPYTFYDNKRDFRCLISVSGIEESNKDVINVGSGSLKKTGKYKVQIYDEDMTKIGDGYEINILPIPELSALKTGSNPNVEDEKWYKYIPETTGTYYINYAIKIIDQELNKCSSKGNSSQAYYMEKGKTYYVCAGVWDEETKNMSIGLSPKVAKVTFEPEENEVVWAETHIDQTEMHGYYHVTTEDGKSEDSWYYPFRGEDYDKFGHLITIEVKDENGNVVEDTLNPLKPGKYTYQIKIDGVASEVHSYTVKQPSGYKKVNVGKTDITLDTNHNGIWGFYEFNTDNTGVYEIVSEGYGYVVSVYYMDANGKFHLAGKVEESNSYRIQKNMTYYIAVEKWDGSPEEIVDGTMTITKLVDEKCEWSSPVVKTPATCGKAGEAVETCKVHGDTRTITIPATGKHTYKWNVVKAPTAVAAGSQVQKCSVCGATGKTETIAKLPATLTLNVTAKKTVPMKVKQTFNVKAISLTKGDGVKSWKSSNAKVATVSKNGKITAKKAGTATITVTLNSGYTTWFKVKVQKKAVTTTSLKVLNKATGKNVAKKVTLKRKGKLNLSAVVAPVTSKQKVTFSSSKKSVATVNSKGVITAKKKGKATITVKSGKKTVKIQITVK